MLSGRVLIYAELNGTVPLLDWLDAQPRKVQDKVMVRVERLGELGHGLRRPECDYLGDGIYELRVRFRRENYRVLYFFFDGLAVLSHGVKKERRIPIGALALAKRHLATYRMEPELHTYRE